VADNYVDKTIANIRNGSKASILFIAKNRKSYQIKGAIEYHSEGPLYQEMLGWADPVHPRKGVAILNSEEVYQGKKRLA
jgi:predicted pyridoxine 5'-phosphate oxidase superfamily flavin-nucleotide-binding protein